MADVEVNHGGESLWQRAERERAEEARRVARAGRNLSGLKKEAVRQVKKNGRKLVAALMTNALAGDVASVRILVMLADKKVEEAPPKKRKRRGLSEAERLALEPEWVDPNPEPEEPWWVTSSVYPGDSGDAGTDGPGAEGPGTEGPSGIPT